MADIGRPVVRTERAGINDGVAVGMAAELDASVEALRSDPDEDDSTAVTEAQ